MADYTLITLKSTVLNQVNKIKGLATAFVSAEADESYLTAKAECGFTFPADTDDDFDAKCLWLKERMRRWYIFQLLQQYSYRFDTSDMKSSQMFINLLNLIKKLDESFAAAKEDPKTAALFIDAEDLFGEGLMVIGPGLEDDRIGISIEDRE